MITGSSLVPGTFGSNYSQTLSSGVTQFGSLASGKLIPECLDPEYNEILELSACIAYKERIKC